MITAQVEGFMAARTEMEPLLPLHWEELALYRDKMPLDVDWGRYAAWEEGGSLLFVTLRDDGRLVGYFVGVVGTSPHYQGTLMCKMDVVYLVPEHRGAGSGNLLMETIKRELLRRGVKLWWMGSKNHKPIEGLFRAHGFTQEEAYFAQWIGD